MVDSNVLSTEVRHGSITFFDKVQRFLVARLNNARTFKVARCYLLLETEEEVMKDIDVEEGGTSIMADTASSRRVSTGEDLFAERESKHLSWSNVNMVLVRRNLLFRLQLRTLHNSIKLSILFLKK